VQPSRCVLRACGKTRSRFRRPPRMPSTSPSAGPESPPEMVAVRTDRQGSQVIAISGAIMGLVCPGRRRRPRGSPPNTRSGTRLPRE